MTDNELAAEELMIAGFCRAFAGTDEPSANDVDCALITELRQYISLGSLSLNCTPSDQVLCVRRNVLRVELERAVVELPETERLIFLMHDVEGYDHARISALLNITENESQQAVYQARLRIRELLTKAK
jgi:DNA-directed RNA polymerase specialized sigma24 family protein